MKYLKFLSMPSIAIIVGAVVIFAGVMFIHPTMPDDKTLYDASQVLLVSKANKAAQDRLRAIAQAHQAKADALSHDYATRGALIRQLDSALSKATTPSERLPLLEQENVHLRGMLNTDSLIIAEQSVALTALRIHADSGDARTALLERNLAATLNVADCRINLLLAHPKCPARGTLVVVSAATAIVLDRLVSKH